MQRIFNDDLKSGTWAQGTGFNKEPNGITQCTWLWCQLCFIDLYVARKVKITGGWTLCWNQHGVKVHPQAIVVLDIIEL